MDRKTWEHTLISIIDEVLSYNPSKETSKEEFTTKANNFGDELMNHIEMNVHGLSRTDKGAFLIKTFATVFVKAAEMGRQEVKSLKTLNDVFQEKY